MRRLLTFVLLLTIVGSIALACGDDDDGEDTPGAAGPPSKEGVLPTVAAPEVTIPPLDATPAPNVQVIPNGGEWTGGQNGVVVRGTGSAEGLAAAAREASGREVLAIWFLSGGVYRWSVPSLPQLQDGFVQTESDPLSTIFVLELEEGEEPVEVPTIEATAQE
ncbi:MAG TPA: hypothetical protein VNL92_04385 [Dehalococcoidia bacterium]|nr:hypothetical protein [Dehalococcoidia bacterium]